MKRWESGRSFLATYSLRDEVREDEVAWACSMHGGEVECI
jgi:hypothetical protein